MSMMYFAVGVEGDLYMSDLISRKKAIQGVREYFSLGDCYCDELSIVGMLNGMPSAEPERKVGKWIECDGSEHWKCSECGYRASYWFNEENSSSYELDMSEWLSDYCPSCGAKMEVEE